ncbi:MAG: ABC transporter permease [Ktedonobacteraceae bacterium]|nr:ABC transporter permease [Ktedonobacteraceae bacterium]
MDTKRLEAVPSHLSDTFPPHRRATRMGIRTFRIILGNEVAKGVIDLWRGKVALVLEMISFGLFFLVITFAQGKGSFQHVAVAPLLLGFVGYMFFHMQTNRLFWGLLGEIQSGTLEQMYLSPLPSWVLLLGLAVASIVEALITAVLMYLLIRLVVPVTIPLRLSALLPLILLVVGSVGYSLMVGGLTLRFKRLEILKELLQGLVFLFGGVFVPLDHMPHWMAIMARFLPITSGIAGLQQALLAESSLGALASDGTIFWLIGNALAYLGLGIIVFRWCEHMAKRLGTLGQY